MTEIRNYDTPTLVAKAAAENAVEILSSAIETNGQAFWVLAGGTSPMAAYRELVKEYADTLDWGKVTVLIGDERFVAYDHPDSNWGAIMKIFDGHEAFAPMIRIAPDILATVELTAESYESQIIGLGIERFDLVWLGVGEDGHTLSLFPGNDAFTTVTASWVVPVHDSPKPPSERISLSLTALQYVSELVIFATGANKKGILRTARLKGGVPISVAAEVAETSGGEVRWLYDDAAWGEK
jgi:6-phosphogluconolactonase